MERDKSKIEASLKKKGFVSENRSHHKYFHFKVDGKIVGISTYLSRGSGTKTYDSSLLSRMRKQLKLENTQQLVALIDCPLDEEGYRDILSDQGLLNE